MKLQLTHNLTPYLGFSPIGLGLFLSVRLYSPISEFEDLNLKVSIFNLILRKIGVEDYVSLTLPVDSTYADEITSRVGGNVEVKIIYRNAYGVENIVKNLDSNVSDFRYDIGSSSASYTLVLRDNFTTPSQQAVVVSAFFSKRKLSYTGALEVYVYSVNPLDFKYYSIGAGFTEDVTVGVISNITLVMANQNVELLIEVEL